MNMDHNKTALIYPFFNYFHVSVKLVYIFFYCQACFHQLVEWHVYDPYGILATVYYVAVFGIAPVLEWTAPINHILLSILAMYRSILFFFPSTEQYIKFNDNNNRKLVHFIWLLYVFVGIFTFSTIFYITVFFLLVISAMFYIPIVIHINKLRHLASIQSNQPQRYVLWQIIAVIFVKLSYIPVAYFEINKCLEDVIYFCRYADNYTTPLLIQLSFLGCNRRHLQSLILSLRPRNGLKVFCCPCAGVVKTEGIVVSRTQVSSTSIPLS